ncbi:Lrp/AsnC family transcriptional regulator [Candidatus Woesearchaeota archaeon]|nr:Lrp/AsnC family transcriptional regulator [Candidatus Woesearchaeota archaeon]
MLKLDIYDRRLLYELDKQSNLQVNLLAKRLRKSKQFVLYRMQRLKEDGVITNSTAIVDMAKLGFFSFRVYFKMRQMTKQDRTAFAGFVKEKYAQVWAITSMSGKWDFALFLGVKTIVEFHKIWDGIMLEWKDRIKNYVIAVYAPIYNFNRTFFLDGKDLDSKEDIVTRTYGEGTPVSFDELDWNLILEYAPNVRKSSLEIARKLGVTADTVRARIKKLEKKKIICGYKIGIDLTKIGYQSYRIDIGLLSTKKNMQLTEFCKQHKHIYQVNKAIGGADFEIEVIVADLQELLAIIDEITARFKEEVDDIDYFCFTTFHLLTYIPD